MVMPNVRRMTKKKLGEILLKEGIITAEHLKRALAEQKTSDKLLGEILLALDACSEKDISETISVQFSIPYISTSQYHISLDIAKLIPVDMMKKYLFVPLDRFNDLLTVAIAGFLNEEVFAEIEKKTRCQAQVFVATISDIKERIDKLSEMLEKDASLSREKEDAAKEKSKKKTETISSPASDDIPSQPLAQGEAVSDKEQSPDESSYPHISDKEILRQLEDQLEE